MDQRDAALERGACPQGRGSRPLERGSVREGIGIRQPDFEQVGSGIGRGQRHLQRALVVRIARHHVRNQGGPTLG